MTNTKVCNKCGGDGELFNFSHIKAGVCFSCNGTGIKHRVTRTKVYSDVWIVSCEGTEWRQPTEVAAIAFATEVACMFLDAPLITKKQTYTLKTSKVVA